MPRFFIDRPIFAWVIAILITLAGSIAIFELPVSAYPPIAPPQVSISASYPGASAEVVEKTVTSVIEQQLTGVDDLLYFNSTSRSNGTVTITLTFLSGTDPDIAQVQVQNRLSLAEPRLPEEVVRNGITVAKANNDFLMVVALKSDDPSIDSYALNNIIAAQVLDPIRRLPGVGGATQFGSGYAMRIWLDPDKLRGYGLSAAQALAAVRAQNVQIAAGAIGSEPALPGQGFTASVSAATRFTSADQFGEIILHAKADGSNVRLKDVARIDLGAEAYGHDVHLAGDPIAGFAIQLAPDANALDVAASIRTKMDQLVDYFPAGVGWITPYDSTQFVRISIQEVVKTLAEAVVLVVLVILLFLQNVRATLIPALVVPVALTGAFAGMYIAGFSINVLSLFGLVLAIGLVVDDAIVVVENVERLMSEEKLSPKEAARKAMDQITGAVIAMTLVLAAVFIPMALVGGSVGVIYRQFSLTIAISMGISALMALSFTPALCATILKPEHRPPNAFLRGFNRSYGWLSSAYLARVSKSLRHTPRWMVVFLALAVVAAFLYVRLPTSFLPEEDQGYAFVIIQLPPGANMERTGAVLREMETILAKLPGVDKVLDVAGFSFVGQGENVGLGFLRLKDWSERTAENEQIGAIIQAANGALQSIKGAKIFVVNMPTVRGLGRFGGFDFQLEDRSGAGHDKLMQARNKLLQAAAQNPVLAGVRPNQLEDASELHLNVDRIQAQSMGLSLNDIYSAIQLMLAPVYANDFNYEGRVLKVLLQADAAYRSRPEDLDRYYIPSSHGGLDDMVPLSSVVTADWTTAPPAIDHYNGYGAIQINGSAAPGYSSGQAMAAMEAIVQDDTAQGIGYEWSGASLQEIISGQQAPILFALSLLVVFLALAALYESWSVPAAVMLVVPLGVLGALSFTWFRGLENDVYFKVGLIAVIGLSAKNAILIIEFANSMHQAGRGVLESTLEACRLRFRPILMTSIAFILGVTPLAISSGAGANSRHAIGTGVMGGMVGATLLGVVFVPVFFVFVRRLVGDKLE
ncbi:efflux RND transporter permease subunit [Thiorhodovibrio frisius]|uniref:Efflux pump membrane transporter n=1 Tax=Thiorhodovibrio frisius TaxID=631362 RepID=H8Z8H5_9GAMM|nr:efflux RND transporter permease subunit [Thiorhodovibrio frisius]EIC19380.1 hydrophobe/amphiphile efflux-1 (HAE1) family transporter [Thiorhodovibrio frisius]WPL22320.1 Acriflavine resistance protein B [Thiorhodovibrio frisius]